jgi:hypothetical protein
MGMSQAVAPALSNPDYKKAVLDRYDERIAYYWKASQSNKDSYKRTRYLMIVLGALVTLVASLSLGGVQAFAVLTPVLAASMAIIGGCSGLSNGAQHGRTW